MRRRLALFAAACLAVPAVALAAAGDPKEAFTPSDQARAKSTLLVRGDLAAGWKRTQTPAQDDLTCASFNPDLSDLTLTGESETEFEHGPSGASLFSYAAVYETPADAGAAWNRMLKPALSRCFAQVIRDAVGKGATVTFSKQGRVAFPKVAPRVYALRIACVVGATGSDVKVPVALDLVVLGRGRGEVTLMTIAMGKGIAQADLRAFARLLSSRLQRAGV